VCEWGVGNTDITFFPDVSRLMSFINGQRKAMKTLIKDGMEAIINHRGIIQPLPTSLPDVVLN
jgi:hypothetical protein